LAEIKKALEDLKLEYGEMGRSFILKDIADGYQFRSHSEYGPYILKMLQTSPNRLSRAALETLAIIAYKQPVLRQEVERYRGVDVGGILRMLGEKDLVKIMGRKDLPGRPLIYGTTKKFLEVFDLQSIEALPKLKEIEALGTEEHEPTTIEEEHPPNGEIDSQRETHSQGGQIPPQGETDSQGEPPPEEEAYSRGESSPEGEAIPKEEQNASKGEVISQEESKPFQADVEGENSGAGDEDPPAN
jgi:segregation and condensation protein B